MYNHKYIRGTSDWGDLTSPPYDMEVFIELCQTAGLKPYIFVNVTGSQMGEIGKGIKKTLSIPETRLFYHYSGHGGVIMKKKYLKQCLIGTDGKRNGKGAFSLLKFFNQANVRESYCCVIADCCREHVKELAEGKGAGDEKPKYGKLIVYTCDEGDKSYSDKNSASAFSLGMQNNLHKLGSNSIHGDLVRFLKLCSSEVARSSVTEIGLAPDAGLRIKFTGGSGGGSTATESKSIGGKKGIREILQSVDKSFGVYFSIFKSELLDTEEKIFGLQDSRLEKLGWRDLIISQWRQKVKYPKGSWQAMMYDNKYGKYVLKLENSDVEDIEDLQDYEDKDFNDVLGMSGPALRKFKRKMKLPK